MAIHMLCKKRQPHYLRYPIWALTCYKDCVLVSGGGGGQTFGIKNKLSLFKRLAKFEDPIAELDTQNELAAYLDWAQQLDVIVACIGTDTAVYRIEQRR